MLVIFGYFISIWLLTVRKWKLEIGSQRVAYNWLIKKM